jgi:predicted RNase H-like HicB family nuclease
VSAAIELTAVFEKVPGGYIAFVEELPGTNTQGATLEEARANLPEAVQLVLEANRVLAEETPEARPVIREPGVAIAYNEPTSWVADRMLTALRWRLRQPIIIRLPLPY